MKAIFDTNILIDFLNGHSQAARELDLYKQKVISIITYMEVLAGINTEKEEEVIKAFLAGFELKALSQKVADKTIELRRQHKRKLPDTIIYATAKVEGCLLVTRNTKDFDPSLPDIRLPYQL